MVWEIDWSLPGPLRFLDNVVGKRSSSFIVGIQAPDGLQRQILEGVRDHLRRLHGMRPPLIDVSDMKSRSPTHLLASYELGGIVEILSVEDFVQDPDLIGKTFLVGGIDQKQWRVWELFFSEARRIAEQSEVQPPRVIAAIPNGLRNDDVVRGVGRDGCCIWRGVTDRIDSTLLAQKRLGSPADVRQALAMETSIEVAGWNWELLEALLELPWEAQIDPREILQDAAAKLHDRSSPSWESGAIDKWGDEVFLDSLSLLAAGRTREFARRIWRAQTRILFPLVDDICVGVIRRHLVRLEELFSSGETWESHLLVRHGQRAIRAHPFEFEISDVQSPLHDYMSGREKRLVYLAKQVRRHLAHVDVLNASAINELVDALENTELPVVMDDWEWPRCGQRLTLMVGPPGAGKSTWARANHAARDIVSSDAIREEFNLYDDNDKVFEIVQHNARRVLSTGRDAVIDATNIKTPDRLANRSIAPKWVPIKYVVVDRPVQDKIKTGDWRNHKPGFIQNQTEIFLENLPEILSGDRDAGVEVINVMSYDPTKVGLVKETAESEIA